MVSSYQITGQAHAAKALLFIIICIWEGESEGWIVVCIIDIQRDIWIFYLLQYIRKITFFVAVGTTKTSANDIIDVFITETLTVYYNMRFIDVDKFHI